MIFPRRICCRCKYFVGILLCTSPFLISHAIASDFTFPQAWELVQQNNDGLAASKANVEEALFIQEAASALYLPKLDITGTYTRLDDDITLAPSQILSAMPPGAAEALKNIFGDPGGGTGVLDELFTTEIAEKNVVTAALTAVWPIYAGGRISAAQDIAQGQHMEAEHLLRIKLQELFEQLNKIYFGVVLAKQLLATQNDAEKGLAKHLDFAKKLEQQGQIASVERLKAEASYTKAKVEQRKAQRNLEIAQIALNQLLQEERNASPSNGLFINNKMPMLDDLISSTLNNHPGLGRLKAKQVQAQGLVKVEKGAYRPEAFIFGNYRLYQQDTLAAELAPDWIMGVGISVPLISRSGRSGKLRAAKSTLTKLDHLKAQAVRDLELLVEKTWREAQTAQEEFNGLSSSLTLAYESIRMRDVAFAQGLSTSLEVVDAELFLVSIKTQRQVAAYQYVLSLARLLALSNQMAQFSDYQNKGYYD